MPVSLDLNQWQAPRHVTNRRRNNIILDARQISRDEGRLNFILLRCILKEVTVKQRNQASTKSSAESKKDVAGQPIIVLSPEERQRRIEMAAYYRYCERGCVDGHDFEDWLAAEADVSSAVAREAGQDAQGGGSAVQ